LEQTVALFLRLASVLGLDLAAATAEVAAASAVALTRSSDEVVEDLQRMLSVAPPYSPELGRTLGEAVRELLALREAARTRKAWAEADRIREALVALRIRVDDTRHACHAVSEFAPERGLPTVNVSLVKG
jgi:cysteinyl-tRNA synthetase